VTFERATRSTAASGRPTAGPNAPRDRACAAFVALCLLALSSSRAFATDFTVTKTADTADGVCDADCSLREAIIAANANPGADRVILGSGLTYTLTLGPADPPGVIVPGSGDLDVLDALTIEGNGSTINAAGLDRVLNIQGSFLVTLNNLVITGGSASGFLSLGGGVLIRNAIVVMNNCSITGNSTALDFGARDDGGGIAVVGSYNAAAGVATLASLTLNNSTVSGNTGLNGGGILCVLCSLTTTNSAISGNTASGGFGGGINVVGNASNLSVSASTLAGNSATAAGALGGGLSVPFGTGVFTLTRSRIVSNTATTARAVFSNVAAVTATNNWWGCNFGPGAGGIGCVGTPNDVSVSVSSTPYLVLKTTASPSAIQANASSTATADLTFNSASADTSAGGTVPNGIVVGFSGTLGTFATPAATTTAGKATDLYTNGGIGGSASLSAVVDGQTASATVAVPVNVAPAITTQPTNRSILAGQIASFTVAASGIPPPSYQWQVSTNAGGTWTNLSDTAPYNGSTTTTLTVAAPKTSATLTGTQYRAVATNTLGTATSDAAILTISVRGAIGDFDGDGTSDLLWRDTLTGQNVVWLMNGGTQSTYILLPTVGDVTWDIKGVGDVTGGGTTDLIWRNRVTGQNVVWLMNGGALSSTIVLPTVNLTWDIKGLGDFTGNGTADVIWRNNTTGQNIVWLMNGGALSSTIVLPTVNLTWDIKGVGDFTGNGTADVVWRNNVTGQNVVWLMNGGTLSSTTVLPTVDLTWDIKGIGDFNGDGQADVIWRNNMMGQNVVWLMSGAALSSTTVLPTVDLTWDVKDIGDFNGDSQADVIWRSTVTGQNVVWLMNGGIVSSANVLATVGDLNWDLVGSGQ
jgi:CSLREA domain-containing protein